MKNTNDIRARNPLPHKDFLCLNSSQPAVVVVGSSLRLASRNLLSYLLPSGGVVVGAVGIDAQLKLHLTENNMDN